MSPARLAEQGLDVAVPSETAEYGVALPDVVEAGGRFISRGQLAAQSLYWLAWLAFSRRAILSSGVQREILALGVGAVRLVVSASFLVGLIATFQIAYQLATFSAESMSATAIGWFTAREIAPLVVALLVVARSSAAIAGELASMNANGEIDALRVMGLDPVKYLVTPKVAALLVVLPFLTVLANAGIVAGGWAGNTFFLGFNTSYFFEQYRNAYELRDLFVGLAKSLLFGFVLGVIAADEGLSVRRRVAAISEAATRSVVFSLIGVLGADTLVNVVFYFIPSLG
jgi:phospholipid/cholesterol/gamma-HCH transport system permease protein